MTTEPQTQTLSDAQPLTAPDGSALRLLCQVRGGRMWHLTLQPGATSQAIAHQSVDELWFVDAGQGEMWRAFSGTESVSPLARGTCVSIPAGTHFQFRCLGDVALEAIGVTLPPWPGDHEAQRVSGPWPARLA